MNLQYTYTRLNVEDFVACKNFYRDVLGLKIKFEDDTDEYVEFDAGSVSITIFNRAKLSEFVTSAETIEYNAHSGRVVLSFSVRNMDEAIAHLKQHGVELLNPPTGYPGRGFISTCFRDPDGNLIELEQMDM